MAADDTPGLKKQPRFKGTGAPATAADLNIISNYAALVGNRKVGTIADRDIATTAGEVWPGLRWKDIAANGLEYEYATASGWVPVSTTFGTADDVTAASGAITITHGLGVIPRAVIITDHNAGAVPATRKIVVNTSNATQIQCVVYNNGTTLGSNPVKFSWVAYA